MEYFISEGTETQKANEVFLICGVNFAREQEGGCYLISYLPFGHPLLFPLCPLDPFVSVQVQ